MLSYLQEYQNYFGPLRLLKYITVRTALAALTALVIGFAVGPMLIRQFRELKLGHGYIDDRTGFLGATYLNQTAWKELRHRKGEDIVKKDE